MTGQLACVGVRAAWRTPELYAQDFVGHPFGSGWLLDRASFGAALRRAALEAGSSLLERCWGAGWIAIGDAAASHDPLASRGLVGALASGLEAAALVGAPEGRLRAWQQSLEAGFERYLRERAQHLVASREVPDDLRVRATLAPARSARV